MTMQDDIFNGQPLEHMFSTYVDYWMKPFNRVKYVNFVFTLFKIIIVHMVLYLNVLTIY